MALTKSQMLAFRTVDTKTVEIEALGEVVIRELSGAQRFELATLSGADELDVSTVNSFLLRCCLTDEDGSDFEVADIESLLAANDGDVIGDLLSEITAFNGLGGEAEDDSGND